ncbi:protein NLRC3 [Polymixia lowei]
MDADTEVERIVQHGEEEEPSQSTERPPSSYGSMRSDDEEEEEEKPDACTPTAFVPPPNVPTHGVTGLQLLRSEYPETHYTYTTELTKPPGACVIDTRSFDELEDLDDADVDEEDYMLVADSPEPPPPVEPEDQILEVDSQPGRIHPEQDMPHVFKNIQTTLSELSEDDLTRFKMCLCRRENTFNVEQLQDCDILDLVDKMIEMLGQEFALRTAINELENINKLEAQALENSCNRVMIRYDLKQDLLRKHSVLYEGVARAGRQHPLDTVYVEPQISTCGYGGVDPYHELRPHPPSPPPVLATNSFVGVNNLFRLRKDDGQLVRTVVTTGIPGIGNSVTVARFSVDWAEERANKDLQFVIPLSFQSLWSLRKHHLPSSKKMSISELIGYYHQVCRNMAYLEEPDCRFLIVMDSFDSYQVALDWETPVLSDIYTPAHLDVLIVNLIRGNLLPAARIWILGRRAAVSNIPAEHIDTVAEIQGYSDEMKDDFLSRRFEDKELAANILAHYKRTPSLKMLCRQPFVCWMAATVFERHYRYLGYGVDPPRLTPFYIHIMVIQTNRKLQRYYGQMENQAKWSDEDRHLLMKMGKMALKMVEKNTSVFFEEDVKEQGVGLKEVTVFSGLSTELPSTASNERKKFCFIHYTFQEFMAAMYIFLMFRLEGKNVLENHHTLLHISKFFMSKDESRSVVDLFRSAMDRTFSSPFGHFDMVLRFLCGMLCQVNHNELLKGMLFHPHAPQVTGLDEVEKQLQKKIESAPADRLGNLKECLRELTQEAE